MSARTGGAAADPQGISVFLVGREAPGVSMFAYPTQSGGRAADLRLENVAVDEWGNVDLV